MSNDNIEVKFKLPNDSAEYYTILQKLYEHNDNKLIKLFTEQYECIDVSIVAGIAYVDDDNRVLSIVITNLDYFFSSSNENIDLDDTIEIEMYFDNAGTLYFADNEDDIVYVNSTQNKLNDFKVILNKCMNNKVISVKYELDSLIKQRNINLDTDSYISNISNNIIDKLHSSKNNIKFDMQFNINLYIKFLMVNLKQDKTSYCSKCIETFLLSYQDFYNRIREIYANLDDRDFLKDFCRITYKNLILNYENGTNFEFSDSLNLSSMLYFKLIFKQDKLVDIKVLYDKINYSSLYNILKAESELSLLLDSSKDRSNTGLMFFTKSNVRNSININNNKFNFKQNTTIEDAIEFIEQQLKELFNVIN